MRPYWLQLAKETPGKQVGGKQHKVQLSITAKKRKLAQEMNLSDKFNWCVSIPLGAY